MTTFTKGSQGSNFGQLMDLPEKYSLKYKKKKKNKDPL